MNAVPVPVGVDETLSLPEPEPMLALPAPTPAPLASDLTPRELPTQAAYRILVSSGIPSGDAAALIGLAVGLAPCQSRWSLKQINGLMFLRNLYLNSEWGEFERQQA